MQLPLVSTRVGASLGVLGAVLSVSSNFIMSGIHPASLGLQVLWLVIPPALIILSISTLAYFKNLPRWLLGLSFGVSVLGSLLQLYIYLAHLAFACFDVCIPTQTVISFWILLGLVGFLLSGIGTFITLVRSQPEKA